MTVRCDFTDMLSDQCAHCLGHLTRPAADVVETVGQSFPSRYPGRCAGCDGHIAEGDLIARAADRSGYVHADQRECAR